MSVECGVPFIPSNPPTDSWDRCSVSDEIDAVDHIETPETTAPDISYTLEREMQGYGKPERR